MHIVIFQGGLANQLFQYCFYKKLIIFYGDNAVYADISHYKSNNDHGGFKLDSFFELRYVDRYPDEPIRVDESNFGSMIIEPDKDYIYCGYWQADRYMPADLSFLGILFDFDDTTVENKELISMIQTSNSVSVHVRRGDYQDNYVHGNIATHEYIINAVEYIKLHIENPVFIIFSDDVEWCERNIEIQNSPVYYAKGNSIKPEQDLVMMSMCKHNIIANSSFSWWAQRLNKNKDKIVVSPEYWFNEINSKVELLDEKFVKVKSIFKYEIKHEKPFFSIVVVARNNEMGVRRCLTSVLNQTFKEIEVIVIDDASADDTYSALKEYEEYDARVSLIKNDGLIGIPASVRKALMQTKGEYVLITDGYGYYAYGALESLKSVIDVNREELYEFGYISEPDKNIFSPEDNSVDNRIELALQKENGYTLWDKCLSKELVKRVIESTRDFFCDYAGYSYFSVIVMDRSKNLESLNDIWYHRVMTFNSILELNKNSVADDIVRSVKNLRREMSILFGPDKRRAINEGLKNEVLLYIKWIYGSQLQMRRKLELIFDINIKLRGFGTGRQFVLASRLVARRLYKC